jgi:hypothetical protein
MAVDGGGETLSKVILEREEISKNRFGEVLLTHELVDRVGEGVSYRGAIGGPVEVPPEAVEGAVVAVSDDGEETELAGLGHGEAIEQDTFGEGKDDGVGSDTEGERGNGDGGEAGAATEHANGVAEVGAKLVEKTEAEGGADVLFVGVDRAELDARAAEGFGGSEAGAFEVLCAELDVSVEFEVDIGLDEVATKKGVEVGAELGLHG